LFSERGDAGLEVGVGQVIEAAKEAKIFTGGEAGVETEVGTSVITKMATYGGGIA